MKKTLIFSGLMLAAAFTLTNCVKETVNPAADAQKGVPFSINVGIDTKTVTLDGSIISWADGDQLNVFHAEAGSTTYGSNDPFTYATAPTSAFQFDGELQDGPLTADAYDWYVLYPYDSHIKTPGEKTSGYTTIYSNQKQDGYDNKEHLAGYGVPLYGKATNVAKDDKPSITLKQLCSVVKINITNTTDAPVQISSVAFTAPENITGNFFVDFTGATAAIAEKSGSVGKTATLSVSGEETIAASGKASFYIAIKPFTASTGTLSVVMNDVCTKSFDLTKEVSFPEGKVSVINVNYTGEDVVAAKTLPYENTLISGHEDFTINNVSTGSLDAIWKDSTYGITANANKTTSDVEAYLVSPVFDLTGEAAAVLNFSHNVRYFADLATAKVQATLEVKAGDADWTAVEIPNYSSNSDNSFVATSVNLTSFCGKMVQVRFKFLATSVNPGRWEIRNFSLKSEVEKSLAVSSTSLNWDASETDEKEVTVTLNDGASGYTVTPSTNDDWNISKDGNIIKVSPKAPNTSTEAAKSITLTIAHADDGNLTKTVTCTQAKASSGGTTTYTKVTSEPTDWSGTYLIVYEESGLVCLAGTDAYQNFTTAEISAGVISSNDLADYEVEIAAYPESEAYSIKALGGANANKYLEGKGGSNGTNFKDSPTKETTFSISDGVVSITNNTNLFVYNSTAGSNGERWRFYKSSTASGDAYKKPALYKKN